MESSTYWSILKKYPPRREYLIQMLTELQNSNPLNYLPEAALVEVIKYTNLSMSAVMGVVEYYSNLYTQPKGRYVVRVCKSPVCINKESDRIMETIIKSYKIESVGNVSSDGLIYVEYCECLGRCAMGSAVSINNYFLDSPKASTIIAMIEQFIKNQPND